MINTAEYNRAAYLRYKESLKANPEKLLAHRATQAAWRRKNGDKRTAENRKKQNQAIMSKLTNGYVAMCIRISTGATGPIPQPLIDIWRQAMTLKRLAKQPTRNRDTP